MYYKPEWEQVIEGYVYRMKTPGGWLVGEQYAGPDGEGCTLCYVPDAGHDWVFGSMEKAAYCPFYEVGEKCSGPSDDSPKALCLQCSCYRWEGKRG